ncbi:serine/threonine protein kinase [Spirillospora sp. CA-294931]|uniref:serine/threonine protein kinase n=1 Tax=Spirillospora sp. CA-294931 TaxID=3240042 RepID=UPI003D911B27
MTDRTMPDAHPLRAGDPSRLGAYEILGRLGEGGQGAVFLGRRTGMEPGETTALDNREHVAIKLLHSGLAGDESARARFVRELEVAKRVARFCTAQVLDADVAGGQPYIVSEFVPGQSLYKVVRTDGPRTGGALERLAISTLTALIAIHQAGIVHRDFKPHNVMMGPDGPRVIDFGVARALGAAGETSNVGTPAYMAPESFTGGDIGPASDMFAWGTTMVFAANGSPAFGSDTMAAVMHRILTEEPELGDLPDTLRELVAACLEKEPANRPTAREAQERLVGAATGSAPAPPIPPFPMGMVGADLLPDLPTAGRGTTAPQLPPPPPPVESSGRKRLVLPLLAAATVAALLAGGSVWAATRSGDDDKTNDQRTSTTAQEDTKDSPAEEALPGGPSKGPKKSSAPSKDGKQQPGPKGTEPGQEDPKTSQPEPKPTKSGPVQEPPNKYTPQAVCNSGGHGGGYYVQRSVSGSGGTAYLLYNSSGYNCAVTLKTRNVGKRSPVSVWIQRKGGSQIGDSGSFEWYAGPVYVSARKECVRFGGAGASAPWGNCG